LSAQLYSSPPGWTKALAIRREVITLKHEVKAALKAGVPWINTDRLNERLQHIAKIPRPGLPKLRCNGRCRCRKGIVG
jgi:hypothetical protein